MSADTFTTAMFLITAVLAAGVLINAVFPIVYNMAGTFSSSTHESDVRIRTDFKIINTFASDRTGTIWMKNTGTARIPEEEIVRSDVFFGRVGDFERLAYVTGGTPGYGEWSYIFDSPQYDLNANYYWDPGETIKITTKIPEADSDFTSGEMVYYLFTLPNGVLRSTEFTASS